MLSLYVYNRDRAAAERFCSKCLSYIRENDRKIKSGCTADEEEIGRIVSMLDDAAVFMVKKDGSLRKISDIINFSEKDNYIVLVFRDTEEMFDAVTPLVRPSGLLLESFDRNRIGRVIEEIYADYMRNHIDDGIDYHFKIKGMDYTTAFSSIVLIEVQSKKIKFHTSGQTYEFYDSLDAVMKEAPDYFVRIHRSYVVNIRFIKDVNFREKTITLNDESTLFFSRHYIHELKNQFYKTIKEDSV